MGNEIGSTKQSSDLEQSILSLLHASMMHTQNLSTLGEGIHDVSQVQSKLLETITIIGCLLGQICANVADLQQKVQVLTRLHVEKN